MTSMSSRLEPAIWSSDTDQRIPRFDRCQLTTTWMSNNYVEDVRCKLAGMSWSMAAVTAFCVPPCYPFPRTLTTSAVCSPFPPLRAFQCWYFLQVTVHCFINTESILNMHKKLTLGLIRPTQKFIGLRLVFINV